MTMKKTDVKDVTIRAMGDNKSAGTSQTTGSVAAPGGPMGHLGGAPSGTVKVAGPPPNGYDAPEGATIRSDSGQMQPDCPAPVEDSLHDSQSSLKVSFPSASDVVSVGTGQGLSDTINNGAKVSFPATADNSNMPKTVSSWMP